MLSSVLQSDSAVQVNIEIMRAGVRLRALMETQKELARKLAELDAKYQDHDERFGVVFQAIRRLMSPPRQRSKGRMGFRHKTT
jgi:hypothetical protein